MKGINIIGISLFLVCLSSCKSDFRCICNYPDGSVTNAGAYYDVYKNYAKAECGRLEDSFKTQEPEVDCRIEKID